MSISKNSQIPKLKTETAEKTKNKKRIVKNNFKGYLYITFLYLIHLVSFFTTYGYGNSSFESLFADSEFESYELRAKVESIFTITDLLLICICIIMLLVFFITFV